jgi:hypothetical protein
LKEAGFVVAVGMGTAGASTAVLGGFMSSLVVVARWWGVDPGERQRLSIAAGCARRVGSLYPPPNAPSSRQHRTTPRSVLGRPYNPLPPRAHGSRVRQTD